MPQIYDVLQTQLTNGQFKNFFVSLLNDYFPFGLLFWLAGLSIFLIIQKKTGNFAFSGAVTSTYFLIISSSGLITSLYVSFAMKWFGIILGIFVGYYIYKIMKG